MERAGISQGITMSGMDELLKCDSSIAACSASSRCDSIRLEVLRSSGPLTFPPGSAGGGMLPILVNL